MNDEPVLSLRDFVLAVNRRRMLFMVLFFAGLAATVAFWKFAPRKFGSEGRIFVQMGRSNLNLDPGSNASRGVTVMDAPEREIRSVMEIVKSQGILRAVAEEIGPAAILKNDLDYLTNWVGSLLPSSDGDSSLDGISSEELAKMKEAELAAKMIGENLKVYLEKNTSVISVYAKARTAAQAKQIVDLIMKKTQEHHLKVHSASSSRDFYSVEYERQSKSLDEAITAQKQFRNANGFLSLDSARLTLQAIIDRVEVQLVDCDVELAESDSRAADLKTQLAGIGEFVKTPSNGNERLSTEGARGRYFDLQNERAKLLSSYDEEHWKVQELDRQMESLKGELDQLPVERTVTASSVNPVFEKTKVDLVALEARICGLKLRRESLLVKKQDCGKQLAQLNERELESSLLQREIDLARNHLAIYSLKLGEAKVYDQLDQQAVSAVVVSQPAIYTVKHVSPKGSIVLPAGTLLSGFLATLVCLASVGREDRRTKGQATAERLLDAPVMATLPRVSTRGQMVR